MSQRALKKRELSLQKQQQQQQQDDTHQIYRKQPQPQTAQKTKYTQRINTSGVLSKQSPRKANQIVKTNIGASKRKFGSTPNLTKPYDTVHRHQLMRSHSESDLSTIPETNVLMNAKSEFHLKSIASTQVPEQSLHSTDHQFKLMNKTIQKHMDNQPNNQNKRMSIQSGLSGQTAGSMTSSASDASTQPPTVGFCDTENIRIPIIGYEVMEERARFTVIFEYFSFSYKFLNTI